MWYTVCFVVSVYLFLILMLNFLLDKKYLKYVKLAAKITLVILFYLKDPLVVTYNSSYLYTSYMIGGVY